MLDQEGGSNEIGEENANGQYHRKTVSNLQEEVTWLIGSKLVLSCQREQDMALVCPVLVATQGLYLWKKTTYQAVAIQRKICRIDAGFEAEQRQQAACDFGEDCADFEDERKKERNPDDAVQNGSQSAGLRHRRDMPVTDSRQQRHAVLHTFPEVKECPVVRIST